MTVREIMASRLHSLAPRVSAQDAALYMKNQCVGMLPVMAAGKVIGVVTDRDIALRCCGEGRDPRQTAVRDIMTPDVVQCLDTADIEEAAHLMETHAIRRLVVVDADQRPVGILSIDDLARKSLNDPLSVRVLRRVSQAVAPCM